MGFSSLGRLLARGGALQPKPTRPDLTIDEILGWADAYHAIHGAWPTARSGPIPETREDTWFLVDKALRRGGAACRQARRSVGCWSATAG